MLVDDFSYPASLVEFRSSVIQSTFAFSENTVEYNSFVGANSALISISGGVFSITDNTFRYNGYLSE